MTSLLSERRRHGAGEDGAVLILAAIAIIVLLALAALAVDAGNLYRNRMALQKAADAAVLAGIGYSIELTEEEKKDAEHKLGLPEDPKKHSKLIELKAKQVFDANLRLMHAEVNDNPDGLFVYDPVQRSLSTRGPIQSNVNLLLMDAVPFELLGAQSIGSVAQVAVNASARRTTANISLIFDVSGSMGCLPDDPVCENRYVHNGDPGQGKRQKMDTLTDAVEVFTEFFSSDDVLGVIPFAMRAYPLPTEDIDEIVSTTGVHDTVIRCLISGQPVSTCAEGDAGAGSNTNVCDAFIVAYEDIHKKMTEKTATNEEITYVMFADGAPTAGRFLFSDYDKLPPNDPYNYYLGGTARDYIHFATRWDNDPAGMSATSYYGPSLIVKTDSLYLQWPIALPPAPNGASAACTGQHVPCCHRYNFEGRISETYPPHIVSEYPQVFEGCLNSFAFRVPYNDTVYAANLRIADTKDVFEKLYYQCAIAAADTMRTDHGTIYTIGVGYDPGVNTAIASEDPYQNVKNSFYRKDVFLSRLANDRFFAVDKSSREYGKRHPENWNPGGNLEGYDYWNQQSIPRQGLYYPSPADKAALRNIFMKIAQTTALKLIR